eukprot:TRINITY_DN11882_c0_g1_i1.p1 TRINITY_DN11882_c0_g1~~TRINITY_DN11882_c0_g1_i1.p1  ORF type:complete len:368 (+),score=44.32 TRINITY_DN11882_c0_g1_i1:71-1174(+)
MGSKVEATVAFEQVGWSAPFASSSSGKPSSRRSYAAVVAGEPPRSRRLFLELTTCGVSEPAKCVLVAPSLTLEDVPEKAYKSAMSHLDVASLCQLDAACRWLRRTNRATLGPWHTLGALAFYGMEIYGEGDFEAVLPAMQQQFGPDWKHRYKLFHLNITTFWRPFRATEIGNVDFETTVYCSLKLRADLLAKDVSKGLYMEIAVDRNPDDCTISLVSNARVPVPTANISFSPECGCVLRERRCSPPVNLHVTYLQPLRRCERHFVGIVGIYILAGQVAFLRKCSADWESTGFVTDLSWLDCHRVIPAVSFRDAGAYSVRIVSVSSEPPIPIELPASSPSHDESEWRELPNVLESYHVGMQERRLSLN